MDIQRIRDEFDAAMAVSDLHGRKERLFAWARDWGRLLLSRSETIETYERRIAAWSECPNGTCGHCIEILCGEHDEELVRRT
jgi:hypothetical protein